MQEAFSFKPIQIDMQKRNGNLRSNLIKIHIGLRFYMILSMYKAKKKNRSEIKLLELIEVSLFEVITIIIQDVKCKNINLTLWNEIMLLYNCSES